MSTQHDLLGNHIEITFEKSRILNLTVYETEDFIEFLISCSLCIFRFSLHHPSKLRSPSLTDSYRHSIFYGVSNLNECKYLITPYFDADTITAISSCLDVSTNDAYFNYGVTSGSVFSIVIPNGSHTESVYYYEMKEGHFITKIFSGFMSRPKSYSYPDTYIIDMDYILVGEKLYLVTVSKDNKLRVWSLKDRYCCVSDDLLSQAMYSNNYERSPSTINYNSLISSHKIKSFYSLNRMTDFSDTVLVYFNAKLSQQVLKNWMVFKINDPIQNSNEAIKNYVNIPFNDLDKDLDLVDFSMGYNTKFDRLIGVWNLMSERFEEGNSIYRLSWTPLSDEIYSRRPNNTNNNMFCQLYEPWKYLSIMLMLDTERDIQESVMECLFTPGNISLMAIFNVIQKYREHNEYETSFNELSINDFKKELLVLVEEKTEKEIKICANKETEIDSNAINRSIWENMLKEIMSEHVILMEPLCLISVAGTIGINRSNSVSLMRGNSGLEQIIGNNSAAHKILIEYYNSSANCGASLLDHLNNCLKEFKDTEIWNSVEYLLFSKGVSPIDVLPEIIKLCPPVPSTVQSRLEDFPDTIEKTIFLLENYEFNDYLFDTDKTTTNHNLSLFGTALLHYTLRQTIQDRIMISIALLALLKPRMINSPIQNQLESLSNRLIRLIKSLISIHWLLSLRKSSNHDLSDVQKNMLSALHLIENRVHDNNTSSNIISLKVLRSLQSNMKLSVNTTINWQSKMIEEMSFVLTFLNPQSDNYALIQIAKYFLTYNLPLELIEYLKFLTSSQPTPWWCDGDFSLVTFLIGVCHLILNKPWKCINCFVDSVLHPNLTSSLLPGILLNDSEIEQLSVLQASLLYKFIEMFDNMNIHEPCIIYLAQKAVDFIDTCEIINSELERWKSIFYMILFKNNLELDRFDAALVAILNNPDIENQKDCLRQFVVTLCDLKKLKTLILYDYKHLKQEFINIVSSRARTSDLKDSHECYYDLLYAYHMKTASLDCVESLKPVAMCMLELALRLENEFFSYQGNSSTNKTKSIRLETVLIDRDVIIKQLQRQLSAYLACVSVINMMGIEDALFVLPISLAQHLITNVKSSSSPSKMTISFNESDHSMDVDNCGDVEVKEVQLERCVVTGEQINQQYCLLRCRMKILTATNPDHSFIRAGKLSPSVTLASLLQTGLYWEACSLCREFNISPRQIIDTVASRCVQIHQNSLDKPILKEKENIVDTLEEMQLDKDFASIGSIHKLIWRLLQELLKKYNKIDFYLRSCSVLLAGGVEQLPSWLVTIVVEDFESANDLIKLYVKQGQLESAAELILCILSNKIDEITQIQNYAKGFGLGKSHSSIPQMKWLHLPVIFKVLEILKKLGKQSKLDYSEKANEYGERIDEKLRLIVALKSMDSLTNLAIQSN